MVALAYQRNYPQPVLTSCFFSVIFLLPSNLVGVVIIKDMLFTTKTEYGLKAMSALAKATDKKPMSLASIAKDYHISQPYLERLFVKLKADGLVTSIKGSNGGYVLARPARSINVFEVVEALEGPLAVFYCMALDGGGSVCTGKDCLTKKVWHELQIGIIRTLRKFKLSDLI